MSDGNRDGWGGEDLKGNYLHLQHELYNFDCNFVCMFHSIAYTTDYIESDVDLCWYRTGTRSMILHLSQINSRVWRDFGAHFLSLSFSLFYSFSLPLSFPNSYIKSMGLAIFVCCRSSLLSMNHLQYWLLFRSLHLYEMTNGHWSLIELITELRFCNNVVVEWQTSTNKSGRNRREKQS